MSYKEGWFSSRAELMALTVENVEFVCTAICAELERAYPTGTIQYTTLADITRCLDTILHRILKEEPQNGLKESFETIKSIRTSVWRKTVMEGFHV